MAAVGEVVAVQTVSEGQYGNGEKASVSSGHRALTRKRTLWGGSALQIGELRLVEDDSQRSGALGSDVVASETASEGQDGNGEKVGMSTGVDRKANIRGGALEVGDVCLVEDGSERSDALVTDVVAFETASEGQDGNGERVRVNGR